MSGKRKGRDAALRRPRPVQGRNPSTDDAPLNAARSAQRADPTSKLHEDAPPYRIDSSPSPLRGEGRGEVAPPRFIDLFCGIGGFRIAFERAGAQCVFSSDWDKFSRQTYAANFGETPHGDIHSVAVADIPKFDILCGGFPCQPFSLAGVYKKNSLGRGIEFLLVSTMRTRLNGVTPMKVDDVISYIELVNAEKTNLQKGMNFGVGDGYAVFLMSVRKGAPYADAIDPNTGDLLYEGHDEPRTKACPDPKKIDQPLKTPTGRLTENGKFFGAAMDFKSGIRKKPLLIKVYEKIAKGIWCYKGFFELTDAEIVASGRRKVCKFHLKPVQKTILGGTKELPHTRLIPTGVKVEVWKRDKGRCVMCGATENLHYDHDIPFSKGGSSLTAANVKLLCLKHNLGKSDKIMCILPWIYVGACAAGQIHRH